MKGCIGCGHPWRTKVFNHHFDAVGYVQRIEGRHVAIVEEHGAAQWRVAYLPKECCK